MINWNAHEKACISSFMELPTSLLSLGLFAFINEHRLFAWYRFETVQKQWVSGFYWFILKDRLGEHIMTIFFSFCTVSICFSEEFYYSPETPEINLPWRLRTSKHWFVDVSVLHCQGLGHHPGSSKQQQTKGQCTRCRRGEGDLTLGELAERGPYDAMASWWYLYQGSHKLQNTGNVEKHRKLWDRKLQGSRSCEKQQDTGAEWSDRVQSHQKVIGLTV